MAQLVGGECGMPVGDLLHGEERSGAGGDEVEEAEDLLGEEEGGDGEAALGAGVEVEAAGGVDVDLVDVGVGEGLEDLAEDDVVGKR